MSVHALRNLHSLVTLPNTLASKSTGKPASTSTLSTYLGSFTPTASKSAASTTTSASASTGFDALFSSYVSKPQSSSTTTSAPTTPPFSATYEVGASVTGPGGKQTTLNPNELATASTAAEVAQLLGGTVVSDATSSDFTNSVPTREISIPGSKVEINAGLAANLFATYGTGPGSQAWVQINQDLGQG